jgi:hypothetical protein
VSANTRRCISVDSKLLEVVSDISGLILVVSVSPIMQSFLKPFYPCCDSITTQPNVKFTVKIFHGSTARGCHTSRKGGDSSAGELGLCMCLLHWPLSAKQYDPSANS